MRHTRTQHRPPSQQVNAHDRVFGTHTTDQAWIESLFGHLKVEHPHLEEIRDPAALDAELRRARRDYNSTRLHAAIGYVTPNDEHTGRGEQIRQARTEGLRRAREQRPDYHRRNHNHNNPQEPA